MKLRRTGNGASMAFLAVAAMTFTSSGTGPASASQKAIRLSSSSLSGPYEIINDYGNGFCLDAENDSLGDPFDPGDKVQMFQCNGRLNQKWYVDSANHTILNADGHSCLDAQQSSAGNPLDNGDKVQLFTCRMTLNQVWYLITGTQFASYFIENGWGLNLDAQNSSLGIPNDNGDKVQVFQDNGQINQQWQLVPA